MPRAQLVQIAGAALAVAAFLWADRVGLIPRIGAYDPDWAAERLRIAPGMALFLLFGLYWGAAARDRGADATSEAAWSVALHRGLVGAGLLLIVLPVPGLMARFAQPSPALVAIGLAIELAGAGLAVAARRSLGRNWSAEVRIAQDHQLVRSGPYRRLRHPIYSGVLLMYLGLAVAAGRLGALVGLGVVLLAYLRKVGLEERLLQRAFGEAFTDYRRTSWALIPPLY